VAPVAALAGIGLKKSPGLPVFSILGDARIMGAFIMAIFAFLLLIYCRFFRGPQDGIMWLRHH